MVGVVGSTFKFRDRPILIEDACFFLILVLELVAMLYFLMNFRPDIVVFSSGIFKTMQSFQLTNHNIPMPELEPHCCKSCHNVDVQFSRGAIVSSNPANINKAHGILIPKQNKTFFVSPATYLVNFLQPDQNPDPQNRFNKRLLEIYREWHQLVPGESLFQTPAR